MVLAVPAVSATENVTITSHNSIQTTIDEVEDGSTITLMPGNYVQWGMEVNKNLTFVGNGASDKIILNAQDNGELFKINGGATVKFYNLTFKYAHGYGYGSAISSEQSSIYLINCNFDHNFAFESGGAIANSGNSNNLGYLYVNNCVFTNNYADHDGGAISSNWANAEIYNSTFKYNSAYRNGGAVKNGDSSTTIISGCLFENNHANCWGGAIYDWPANNAPGKIEIYNSIINNNSCGEYGGGIYFSGPPIIKNSTITNNNAGEYGGGIGVDDNSLCFDPIEIEGNLIYNNTADKKFQDIYIVSCSQNNIFNRNYWGIDDPINGTDYPFKWEERINEGTKSSTIQIWLTFDEMKKEDIVIPENKPDSSNNGSMTNHENATEIVAGNGSEIEDDIVSFTRSSISSADNLNEVSISSNGEQSSGEVSKKQSTIKKVEKDSKKEISADNIVYLVLIVVFLCLAYGYYRLKK